MRYLSYLLLGLFLCVTGTVYSSPAAAGPCTKYYPQPGGTVEHVCNLGTMPYGTGYNTVVPQITHLGTPTQNVRVYCQLQIYDRWGYLVALPLPIGGNLDRKYYSISDIYFDDWGSRYYAYLGFKWAKDKYANHSARFYCREPHYDARRGSRFTVNAIGIGRG